MGITALRSDPVALNCALKAMERATRLQRSLYRDAYFVWVIFGRCCCCGSLECFRFLSLFTVVTFWFLWLLLALLMCC